MTRRWRPRPRRLFFGVPIVFALLTWGATAHAGFLSQFSLSTGEEYNNNIEFSEKKIDDFITFFRPSLSLYYKPSADEAPVWSARVESVGQIFARDSKQSNFGDNTSFNTAYTYLYSPRLRFNVSDTFRLLGNTRTAGASPQADTGLPVLPSGTSPSGTPAPTPVSTRSTDLVTSGDVLTNFFSARGRYGYRPDLFFTGGYSAAYSKYITEGGHEVSHRVGGRGVYKWGEHHNFHLGYNVQIINSRDGDNSVVHNVDFGDDYLTRYDIQLTPTLQLSARTGVSFNTGSSGPRVANNSTVDLIQIWKKARLNLGFRRRMTSSLGVAGISQTTSVLGNFFIQWTRKLSGTMGTTYSLFDTDEVDFSTLQASAGLQYWIFHWLQASLSYNYNMRNSGSGSSSTVLRTSARLESHGALLSFTAYFDLYPEAGYGKASATP